MRLHPTSLLSTPQQHPAVTMTCSVYHVPIALCHSANLFMVRSSEHASLMLPQGLCTSCFPPGLLSPSLIAGFIGPCPVKTHLLGPQTL